MLDYPDIIGWIGNLGFIVGCALLAKGSIKGWYLNFFGNLCYVAQGIMKTTPSLTALSLYLMVINIVGIISWKKKENDKTIRLPKEDLEIMSQINEFLTYIKFFAEEKYIKAFENYKEVVHKYQKMSEETNVRKKTKKKTTKFIRSPLK